MQEAKYYSSVLGINILPGIAVIIVLVFAVLPSYYHIKCVMVVEFVGFALLNCFLTKNPNCCC